MKSIIEQLCKGEVEYVSLKLPKDRLEKEMSYYDKIILSTGGNNYGKLFSHHRLPPRRGCLCHL